MGLVCHGDSAGRKFGIKKLQVQTPVQTVSPPHPHSILTTTPRAPSTSFQPSTFLLNIRANSWETGLASVATPSHAKTYMSQNRWNERRSRRKNVVSEIFVTSCRRVGNPEAVPKYHIIRADVFVFLDVFYVPGRIRNV